MHRSRRCHPAHLCQIAPIGRLCHERAQRAGIGRENRVAIVMPNGPLMATSFITFTACTTTAPLNPSYRVDEYDFYMRDLGAQALVVERG